MTHHDMPGAVVEVTELVGSSAHSPHAASV
jgi:hypothetical protein